jgi:pimeloyl-ACP methyl ester carboxylesterase
VVTVGVLATMTADVSQCTVQVQKEGPAVRQIAGRAARRPRACDTGNADGRAIDHAERLPRSRHHPDLAVPSTPCGRRRRLRPAGTPDPKDAMTLLPRPDPARPDGAPRTRRGTRQSPAAPVTRREITLHDQRVTFLETGERSGGPTVVLLHGLASSSATWLPVLPLLGRHAHVIAPDLLGHGESAKPRNGDYSLGAYAAGLRDLLVALHLDGATVVGHSFGGGVAMQFAYQFPELTERLVLDASGGLGPDVSIALRAASLPGTATVLRVLNALTPRTVADLARRAVRIVPGVPIAADELARALTTFADDGARGAFVHTVRSALNWSGQRLDGNGRLYLLADVPVLLVGGTADAVFPVAHTTAAHDRLPGSRLEIFDDTGHFPHSEHPARFAGALLDFLRTTSPAHADVDSFRRQLLAQGPRRTADGVPA